MVFTEEVTESLAYLRRAISDVSEVDPTLSDTLTAVTDDLVVNLENQILLFFSNWGVMESEKAELLKKRRETNVLANYFRQVDSNGNVRHKDQPIQALSPSPEGTVARGLGDTLGAGNATLGQGAMTSPKAATKLVPEMEAQKHLATSIYVTLEAMAHKVQAERVILYLANKANQTLRVLCSVPDCSPAAKGAFIGLNQGIPGSTVATGVGVRVDTLDEEMRKLYVRPVDMLIGCDTHNVLAMPVVHTATGAVVGVVECANKAKGVGWCDADEAYVYQTANLILYMLTNYEVVDFNAGVVFNPAPLHFLKPYRPGNMSKDIMVVDGATGAEVNQLVVRIDRAAEGSKGEGKKETTVKTLGGKSHVERAQTVGSLINVKEIRSYLNTLEESYRSGLNQLVLAQQKHTELTEEVQRKTQRIRVLEENIQFLTSEVENYRHTLHNKSFVPHENPNSLDFDPAAVRTLERDRAEAPVRARSMSRMESSSPILRQHQSVRQATSATPPPHSQSPAHEEGVAPPPANMNVNAFVFAANQAIAQLRKNVELERQGLPRKEITADPFQLPSLGGNHAHHTPPPQKRSLKSVAKSAKLL